MMRGASIETKISPKAEEKKTALTGLQSVHEREGGKFDPKKKHKKGKPMHEHFIHAQSYIT